MQLTPDALGDLGDLMSQLEASTSLSSTGDSNDLAGSTQLPDKDEICC